jgi:hypothetical protein
MALKNLYDMVKADRYTADGREALIKAQEAETEDKVYQIGEISQKTGLQKTANGWVKPKNGKQPGAKKQNAPTGSKKIDYQVTEKGGKFYATGHQFSDGSQLHAGPFGSEKELHEFMNGSPYKSTAESKPGAKKEEPKNVHGAEVDKIYERQLKRIKELKAKGFTDEQIDNDKIIKQTKEDMKNVGKKPESKPAAEKSEGRNFRSELEANPKGAYDFEKTIEHSIPMTAGDKEILGRVKSFMQEEGTDYKNALKAVATGLVNGNRLRGNWYPEKEQSLLKIAKAVGMDDEVKSYVKTLAKGYDFGYSEDSAPRVLTGDTRIRVRKA